MVSTKSPNKGKAPPKTTPLHLFLRRLQNGATKVENKSKNKQPEKKITKQDKTKNRIKNIEKK